MEGKFVFGDNTFAQQKVSAMPVDSGAGNSFIVYSRSVS